MKILAVTDLHQRNNKWKLLTKICEGEKFDIIAVAGDVFPKDEGIIPQLSFVRHLKKYAHAINKTGAKLVLILGNDDNQNCIPYLKEGHKKDWYYISEEVEEIDGYEFIGMPYVPDYPFGYKYWCRAEFPDILKIDPVQFTEPVIINEHN